MCFLHALSMGMDALKVDMATRNNNRTGPNVIQLSFSSNRHSLSASLSPLQQRQGLCRDH